jgi:hypothetical protein
MGYDIGEVGLVFEIRGVDLEFVAAIRLNDRIGSRPNRIDLCGNLRIRKEIDSIGKIAGLASGVQRIDDWTGASCAVGHPGEWHIYNVDAFVVTVALQSHSRPEQNSTTATFSTLDMQNLDHLRAKSSVFTQNP